MLLNFGLAVALSSIYNIFCSQISLLVVCIAKFRRTCTSCGQQNK